MGRTGGKLLTAAELPPTTSKPPRREKKKASRAKLNEELVSEFREYLRMKDRDETDDDEDGGAAAPESPNLVPRWIKNHETHVNPYIYN